MRYNSKTMLLLVTRELLNNVFWFASVVRANVIWLGGAMAAGEKLC